MAVRDRADISSPLQRKGFVLRQGKRDHDFYYFELPGLTSPIFTKLSRGSSYKTYGNELLYDIKRQLKLTTSQLLDLIDCPLGKDEYLKILTDNGVINRTALTHKLATQKKAH